MTPRLRFTLLLLLLPLLTQAAPLADWLKGDDVVLTTKLLIVLIGFPLVNVVLTIIGITSRRLRTKVSAYRMFFNIVCLGIFVSCLPAMDADNTFEDMSGDLSDLRVLLLCMMVVAILGDVVALIARKRYITGAVSY